jgi:nickel-dependent lactate racemase
LSLSLKSDWNVDIFYPKQQEVIHEPIKAIRNALNNPIGSPALKNIIHQKKPINHICIVVSDQTRPVPSHLILQALIKELNENGVNDNQIFILIATGLHRPCRESELKRIIGKQIKDRIEIIGHIATNKDQLVYLGTSIDGVPIWINKHYYKADLKILTGYVEPHFFAGFSGGRKSVIPGIAGQKTIQGNHSAENIASPYARFGINKENPIHKNSMEITKKVGVDFIVNVCINQNHQINKVSAGNLEAAHKHLINFQKKKNFKKIDKPYDIVVCGNGGFP